MAPIPRARDYTGAAVLSYGFRPFFLLAALYAGLTVLIWLSFLSGHIALPTVFHPVDWHVHEMLFGYQVAAMAGFLLTAIPNWTGRLPVQGTPLLVLVIAWIAGRIAVAASAIIGWRLAMAVDALLLLLLGAVAAREIAAGKNWRNLKVVSLVALLLVSNVVFHVEAATSGSADQARRLSVAVLLILVAPIAGRIVPSFTRNWLAQQGSGRLPIPFGGYDRLVIAATVAALAFWIVTPRGSLSAAALAARAVLHLVRLMRWAGDRTWRNALLMILHVGYLFVPVGFGLTAAASLDLVAPGAGLHAWTAGAFGVTTLAVMSRARANPHSGYRFALSAESIRSGFCDSERIDGCEALRTERCAVGADRAFAARQGG